MICKTIKNNGLRCDNKAIIFGYCNIHFRSRATNKEKLNVKRYVNKKIKEMLKVKK